MSTKIGPKLLTCSLAIVFASLGIKLTQGKDWAQFLGAQRTGISSETGFIDRFTAAGPKIAWRVAGGVGMSGIAITSDHAITMWNSADREVVVSLNPATGKTNWSTPLGAAYKNSMGDGPRATPTIVGERVYAYTGGGRLVCLQLADGKEIWSLDVPAKHGVKHSEYGMSSSPLVVGQNVIVTCGGNGSAVVSIDAADGSVRWKAVNGAAGYSSPAWLRVAGEQQVVAFTGASVSGINADSGKVLWSYPFQTPYDCNTATPILIDGKVFISAGENHGCALLEITKSGDAYKVREVWQSTMTKSVMRNEWQTSIQMDGYIYGFDNVGSAGPTTHLTCIEAATGKPVWQKTRFGKGNLVAADGKLWISTMKGEMVIVEASPDGFEELGRAKVMGKTRQAFAIANGHALIRDDKEVICVDLRR